MDNNDSTYIAVSVPAHWKFSRASTAVARRLNEPFNPVAFGEPFEKADRLFRLLYITVSNTQNVQNILDKMHIITRPKLFCHVPRDLPTKIKRKKPMNMQDKVKNILKIAVTVRPYRVLVTTHRELINELQYKYSGLYYLDLKCRNKLLDRVSRVIFNRLKPLIGPKDNRVGSFFELSQTYRKTHPHSTDFELIMSQLHDYEQAARRPKSVITESKLMHAGEAYHHLTDCCNKYTNNINKKIAEHLSKLDSEIKLDDSPDERARKIVREHLKKMAPEFPYAMSRGAIGRHILQHRTKGLVRLRMYGEPYLPPVKEMRIFTNKFKMDKIKRSKYIFNMLECRLHPSFHLDLMTLDYEGIRLSGARLIIRTFRKKKDNKLYRVYPNLKMEMRKFIVGGDGVLEYDDELLLKDEDEDSDDDDEDSDDDDDGDAYL